MKLLNLKIGQTKNGFRSLPPGFSIQFRSLNDLQSMSKFNPFCFAGLNGSGKSNVLEALSAIFCHMEFSTAVFTPESFKKYFDAKKCSPDAFELTYLIAPKSSDANDMENFVRVRISKEENKEPAVFILPYPFDGTKKERKIPLAKETKLYLPDHVIAYSSGENEVLSLPYRKCRLVHLDEYIQGIKNNYEKYTEPENSLIFIDNNMSQAVLLACLLFENEETLKPIAEEAGITDIQSFRMHINFHRFNFQQEKETAVKLLENEQIAKLKKCATSWFADDKKIYLDFFVNKAAKEAFKNHFKTSFELFQVFRILYELNSYKIGEEIKEDVYASKGFYTDWKLPTPSPKENIFHFLDFKIVKKIKETNKSMELLLRELSDGEHQFLHTVGICLLMKDRRTLLLLDEPETHFNPNWRAKFIQMLYDGIESGKGNAQNAHLQKDIILTSHSPFVLSDCMPDNVIFFDANKDSRPEAKNAKELGVNTYGAGVDFILKSFFKTGLNSAKSFTELRKIIDDGDLGELQNAVEQFGESYEKQFLFKKIYEKMKEKK